MGRSMTSPLSPEAVAQMVADLPSRWKDAAPNPHYRGEELLPIVYADPGSNGWYYRERKPDSVTAYVRVDLITTLAAENASLRAEQAMLKFDIDKMLTQIEEHNAAWDELRASEAAAVARADHALALAADVIDRDIKKIQPEMTRRGQRLADGKKPGFQYAIHRADLDARISCRDKILALRDKPAPAVTVQKAILEVWGCCEELEDEALAKLSGVKTEHEKGFWTGQKMTAKRIRRATQMPIAGGGDE